MAVPLFEHLSEVGSEIRAAPHLLLGVDFDGTLAPIVARGEDARMPPDARAALESAAALPGVTVAVVSGREISDLAARTSGHLILAGNHGLEIRGDDFDFEYPDAAASRDALRQECQEIRARLTEIPGAVVEDKGLTATVHFRNVSEDNQEKLAVIVHSVLGPENNKFLLRDGRKTIEIRPRVAWNKGSAMLWLRDRIKPAGKSLICYIGDDGTDEDVFRVVNGITILVGSRSTAARFRVGGPREVTTFLEWLARGAGAA